MSDQFSTHYARPSLPQGSWSSAQSISRAHQSCLTEDTAVTRELPAEGPRKRHADKDKECLPVSEGGPGQECANVFSPQGVS